jgi:soluble lytic murein transglycosylase-like protein
MSKLIVTILIGHMCLTSAGARAGDIFVGQDSGASIVISNVPSTDDFDLLLAGPRDEAAVVGKREPRALANGDLKGTLLERARRYTTWVDEAAHDTSVDAYLLHAVIAAESAYNPAALSPKGAVGIMQLLPATARRYGVEDSYDARQNIRGGARYLADLLKLFKNDTSLAVAAYNAGENAVLRHGGKVPPYRETEAYVPRVLGLYRHFASVSL